MGGAIKMGITARPGQSKSSMVVQGGVLQCLEAATLGMPFEVWKTRMGRFRTEGTMEAFHNVKKSGGYKMFWQGTSAKMVESATKGGVLLVAKETIKDSCMGAGMGGVAAGLPSVCDGSVHLHGNRAGYRKCQGWCYAICIKDVGRKGHQGILPRRFCNRLPSSNQLGVPSRFH